MPDDTTPRNQAQPPAIPGPQAGQDDSLPRNEADYQRLLAEMEARYSGSSLPPETALKFLLDDDETTWCHPEALALLAMFRHDPIMWLSITTANAVNGLSPMRVAGSMSRPCCGVWRPMTPKCCRAAAAAFS